MNAVVMSTANFREKRMIMSDIMSGNPVIVVDVNKPYDFENLCRKLIEMDYILCSSNIGFTGNHEDGYEDKYQAVFVKTASVQGSPTINSTTNIETNTAPINIDNRD